ncbi:hypothetical protein HGI30_10425 [Paenibacillus albicereus]|uniref:Phosphohydrolase n=1 Tax=Paenibacillus albicereus TaxID=2726185 RepID=A0A6H2GWX2_9BACL|nr:hypothetical protein [Paenibacillus albicereus]QJC51924.1 hypothetical protein HGI30_10425 [Paenibacillus albicereus]
MKPYFNGKAWIVKDPERLRPLAAFGKVPLLGIGIEVEECYMHCAKAFKRSHAWEQQHWLPAEERPRSAEIISAHVRQLGLSPEDIAASQRESFTKRLY